MHSADNLMAYLVALGNGNLGRQLFHQNFSFFLDTHATLQQGTQTLLQIFSIIQVRCGVTLMCQFVLVDYIRPS